jgi:fumarylacetoacetate (FAA) hydrolase
MYQGGSDSFLAPTEDIPQVDFSHGTDFEGEVAVITDDVPMGVSAEAALDHIQLVVLVNDVSLRGLIPEELAMGFGFFQSKPSSAFSPFALTLDELGSAWRGGRLHLPLHVLYNGQFFGRANAGEMHFHFGQLIAHAARTRDLRAGTIIGSGTVSNEDPSAGSSCLAEKRMIEQINQGKATTPFMKPGDTIEIFMSDEKGQDLFGHIRQKVVPAGPKS